MGGYAMTLGSLFSKGSRYSHLVAALAYLAVVGGLLSATGWIGSSIVDDYFSLTALRERLVELEARKDRTRIVRPDQDVEFGSPFIRGATITQAGADLQSRIGRAVNRAGGSLLSSQVELDGQASRAGAISLNADVEIAQRALQGFLYDIEAGKPYLFIDNFSAQSSQAIGESDGSRLHVSLGVSGQWEALP